MQDLQVQLDCIFYPGLSKNLHGFKDLKEFIQSLEKPR